MDTAHLPRDRDDYALSVRGLFRKFLEDYKGDGPENGPEDGPKDGPKHVPKYSEPALLLLTSERNTLFIDFKDVEIYDGDLADDIILEYYRIYPYLCHAVASFVRDEKMRLGEASLDPDTDATVKMAERQRIKSDLDRPQIKNKDYYVGFYNFSNRDNIRDLSCTKIGTLTRVSGQVVRTHSVHPELILGCFKCKDCLAEQSAEQQFRYTEPALCTNENCANRSRYELKLQNSRFTDFQRIRIQETQQELPRGCIPRSFDVVIRGADQVECIQPGDQCDFVGTLIAVPDVGQLMSGTYGTVSSEMSADSGVTGLKLLGVKEMTHSLAFLANACILDGQTKPCVNTDLAFREAAFGSILDVEDFSKEEVMKIEKMSLDPNLLDNLSQSLFSSIYGSDDIKRGIVLQLLGGVPKNTSTGTKLRGDINICLVGDPSTAKSQFLKIVTDFAPVKAVYTSGKASSASGLTAAVVRDTDGGFVIEAGALMLADRGICCIDEFDKMDLKDQVAIHEAMEQQTISITKAGVTATLNARASILAAANPINGVYDTSRDLRANVNFSLPIMSRFDLFFTIIDPHETTNDHMIAKRIVDMHRTYANSNDNRRDMIYSFEDIRLYLRFARKYYPKIPIECEKVYVREYVRLRSNTKTMRKSTRITVRQLESLIRLSEAIARSHCNETVKPEYIEQAAKLIAKTIVAVGRSEVDLSNYESTQTAAKDDVAGSEMGGDQGSQGMYEGELESQRLQATQDAQARISIPSATYKEMADVFVAKLRHAESSDDSDTFGMRQSDLIDWYLTKCVDEIATESELIKKKQLSEKVIDRLVKCDQVLMEIREDGQLVVANSQAGGEHDHDRMLIVNPNYDETDDDFNPIIG